MLGLAELPYRFAKVFPFGRFNAFEGIKTHGESRNGRLGVGQAAGLNQSCQCSVVSLVSYLSQTFRPGRKWTSILGHPPLRLSQLAY
ncbi:hypothetical protein D3C73_1439170 [compost metagenome]